MTIYDQYAQVYDDSGQIGFSLRMIPYLQDLLERHPAGGRSMLDLACGTGTVLLSFCQQGWESYGVDGSAGMLDQARKKAEELECKPILSQQDMRHFVLPHPVALVTCLYDSLNYLLTVADLRRVFGRTAAALQPGGLFLGDMNTDVTLKQVWGNNTFFVEGPQMALILRSSYEPDTRLSGVDIVGFVRQESGLFDRFEERHMEIAHPNEEVQTALQESGLQLEASYQCFTFAPVDQETRRVMWVARKSGAEQ